MCALLALLIAPGSKARAQEGEVDVGYFYEQLEPYGRWIEHPRWGDVWSPDVDSDWRPYSQGYWSYTEDNGWYWISDEPFGWAVFHYGRWVLDEDDGWLWLPGSEWAPAWVAWRADDDDDGFVGWAPLPPDADWGPGGDLVYDQTYYDGPRFGAIWIFVRPTYMTVPGMYRYAAPRQQNVIILRRARHLRAFRKLDRRVFNAGLDLSRYERLVGRPVPRMRLRSISSPREQDAGDRSRGSDIPVFRPNIVVPRDGPRPRPTFKAVHPPKQKTPYVGRPPESRGTGPDGPGDLSKGKAPDGKDKGARKGPDGPPGDGAKGPGLAPKGSPKPLPPATIAKEPPYKGPPQERSKEQPKDQPARKAAPKGPSETTTTPLSKGTPPAAKGPYAVEKAPASGPPKQPVFKSAPQQPVVKAPPQQQEQRPTRTAPEKTTKSPDRKPDRKDDKKGADEPK